MIRRIGRALAGVTYVVVGGILVVVVFRASEALFGAAGPITLFIGTLVLVAVTTALEPDDATPSPRTITADQAVDNALREICAERCAQRGELPCWLVPDGPFPPHTCDDPDCRSLAEAAVVAITGDTPSIRQQERAAP